TFFLTVPAQPPLLHSFPTRRSSDLSPVLLLAAVCVVIPLTITDPAAGLVAILVGGFSSLPALAIVHRLMHKYSTMDAATPRGTRSEEHTSELQSRSDLVCRLLLEKK